MGAFFAGLVVGIISDKIGRKPTLLLLTIPSVIGWYCIAVSFWFVVDNDYQKYLAIILAGRCLTGFAAGGYSIVVPVSKYRQYFYKNIHYRIQKVLTI